MRPSEVECLRLLAAGKNVVLVVVKSDEKNDMTALNAVIDAEQSVVFMLAPSVKIHPQLDEELSWLRHYGMLFVIEQGIWGGAETLKHVFKNKKADLILFASRSHYDELSADLFAVIKLLEPGGVVCGFGWENEEVRRALSRLLPGWQATGDLWYQIHGEKCSSSESQRTADPVQGNQPSGPGFSTN